MIPLVVIVGPTASGKTDLAIEIALETGGEIVSADSMQVYRGMDIGTAKPSVCDRRGVLHHLIDVVEPEEDFSAGLYARLAHRAISDIHKRGRLPILAGGTGLYIDIVTQNLNITAPAGDSNLRKELNERAEREGRRALYDELCRIDPESAAALHENDVKRVVRALEIYYTTGKTKTQVEELSQKTEKIYDCLFLGLETDREVLYNRINKRVDKMVESGLFDEVSALYKRLGGKKTTAMQGLGYKEVCWYLRGLATREEALRILKRDTRRYAKRQMTWFRKNSGIVWLNTSQGLEDVKCRCLKLISGKGFL